MSWICEVWLDDSEQWRIILEEAKVRQTTAIPEDGGEEEEEEEELEE